MQQGDVIARRYRLDRLLGSGGMGAVWAATHVVTGKAVALKLLRPRDDDENARRRVVREAATFRVMLDPGSHVFLISREGFTNAVHAELVRPGERRVVTLAVERMPATLAITSNEPSAVVSVDRLDVGIAPVLLSRPAGTHHILVRKPGFDPYEIDANVAAGQRAELSATLKQRRPSVFTQWWFWTAAATVIGGAAVTTYVLARPAPQRPPLDGGGLGWAVRVP